MVGDAAERDVLYVGEKLKGEDMKELPRCERKGKKIEKVFKGITDALKKIES